MALPAAALAVAACGAEADVWPHLLRHVLPYAAAETALLLLGVGCLTLALGAGPAWLVAQYDFPGRAALRWLLALPMALPGYIAAYAYLDMTHPLGPMQAALRWALGDGAPRLPEIRSLPGCVAAMSLVLYPYVYLPARAAFADQAADAIWAARGVGASGWRLFRHVGLPAARPAIGAGLGLALMEALNDVGAAEFLGVRTLTVSVYTAWLTQGSLPSAARIALPLLAVVLALLWAERRLRPRTAFVGEPAAIEPTRLPPLPGALAALACAAPVALGFAAPVAHLAWKATERVAWHGLPPDLPGWIANSAFYAGWAALAAAGFGLCAAFAARSGSAWPARIVAAGYAMPAGVAAVGLIVAFGWIDDGLEIVQRALFGSGRGWFALGSGFALVAAYAVRFMAVSAGGLDAAYARLAPDYDQAARGVGCGPLRLLARIHMPLLAGPLGAAALIVFVDAMKELPATLLMRPVGVETLATALYAEAARGAYEDGAVAALALVAVAVLPAALLTRRQPGRREARTASARAVRASA